jgi:hypothetical protein
MFTLLVVLKNLNSMEGTETGGGFVEHLSQT